MNREEKGKLVKGGTDMAEKVVIAVKASKEIHKTALVWALTHVVQPGDCITLLVVVPSHGSGTFFLFLIGFASTYDIFSIELLLTVILMYPFLFGF